MPVGLWQQVWNKKTLLVLLSIVFSKSLRLLCLNVEDTLNIWRWFAHVGSDIIISFKPTSCNISFANHKLPVPDKVWYQSRLLGLLKTNFLLFSIKLGQPAIGNYL